MGESFEKAIEFRRVGYQVSPGITLIDDLNLSVRRGETVMLLGRSGSGKTTCLKLINRLLLPTSGDVFVDNKRSEEWDPIRLTQDWLCHTRRGPFSPLHGLAERSTGTDAGEMGSPTGSRSSRRGSATRRPTQPGFRRPSP